MVQTLILTFIFFLGSQSAPQTSHSEGTAPAPSRLFSHVLPEAKKSGLPVLLPSELPYYVDPRRVHNVSIEAKEGSYYISLHYQFGCADECFVGTFSASRKTGNDSGGRRKIDLANGIVGYYSASPCGAACPPAEIDWVYQDVWYTVQFTPDEAGPRDTEAALIKLANSCIEAGPR